MDFEQAKKLLQQTDVRIKKFGSVDASTLTWTPWQVGGVNVGYTTMIDTSAAQFQATPAYMAQIVGSRAMGSTVVIDSASVSNPSPAGFTLQVALSALDTGQTGAVRDSATGAIATLNWSISWMGVGG